MYFNSPILGKETKHFCIISVKLAIHHQILFSHLLKCFSDTVLSSDIKSWFGWGGIRGYVGEGAEEKVTSWQQEAFCRAL